VRVVSAATSDAVDVRVAADAPLVFKVGKVTGVVYEGGATVPAPGATVSFGMASAVKGLTIDAKGTPDNFADDEISVPDLSEFGVQDFSWRLTVPGDATEFTSSVFKGPTVIPSDLILEAQGAGGVVGEGAYTLRVSYSVPTLGEISLYAGFRLSLEGIALVVSDVQLPAAVEATSAVSVVAGADGAYQAFVRAPAGAPMTGRAVRAGGAKEDAQTFQYVSTSPIFTVPLDFVFPLDAPPAIPAGLKHGWNPMPSMPTGRAFARTAVLDGKVWIVGGSDDEETRTTISVFDPMTGTTTPKTSATQGRDRYGGALTAAAAAGRVYAIGGFSLVGGSLASIDAYDPATDAWSPRAPMSVGREAAAVAAVGNKIYVCGGVNGNQGFLTSVEIYDPVAGAWSPGPTMPVSVWTAQFGGGVAVGGKLYVMGHPNYVSEVRTHVLDIATSVWSPLVDYPRAGFSLSFVALHGDLFAVEATNPLDVGFAMSYSRVFDVVSARWGVAPAQAPKLCLVNLAEVAGVVYAVGGAGYYAGGGHSLDVSAYRPAWRSRPRLPTARADAAAAAMSGKVYVAGGRGTAGTTLATLDVFDPSRDLWKPRAAMQGARESFSLVAVNGVVYAIGGFDRATGAALATVEAYVPGLNQWSPRAPMSKPRSGATATVLGGKILVAGGGDDSAEEYDPATDSWTPRASMSSARTSAGGAALGSSAFAFGGAVGGVPTATTEVYDPAEDSWSARGPLTTPRSQAAGAVLDGRPIAIGGVDGAGDVLASVEVFEPSLNQWTTRDALVLPFGRRGAAAAELDGVVYLFGGADAAGAPLRAAMSLEPE
jgi:N-acetylneuraminic acid mutarotase